MSEIRSQGLKELLQIVIAIVILTFVVNFHYITASKNFSYYFIIFNLILVAIVILVNVFTKKAIAFYYEAKIQHKLWMLERYGWKREAHFNKPLPLGILLPFFISLFSYGYVMIMTLLEFDVYSTTARTSKMHGINRFTEMTEIHIGLIAAAGVVANLIAAVVGYIAGFPEFSRLSIYYACFSMIPLSNLDGSKIFFSGGPIGGSRAFWGLPTLWVILSLICIIFLGYALLPY